MISYLLAAGSLALSLSNIIQITLSKLLMQPALFSYIVQVNNLSKLPLEYASNSEFLSYFLIISFRL